MKSSKSNEFYIGWQDGLPPRTRRLLILFITALFTFSLGITYLVVKNQKPFNDHQFELGNIQEFSGVLVYNPAPILLVEEGIPNSVSDQLLLVGYGKRGALGFLQEKEEVHGQLGQRQITLRGTLIYGDGRAVLELTEKGKSLVEVNEHEVSNQREISNPQPFELQGEVLDPKCYFGVMKPGEGKIHKSCAIRCISGGIPPVFRSRKSDGSFDYSLMKDAQGQDINQRILPFVAENIQISGQSQRVGDWNVLYVDMDKIRRT